MSEKIELYKKVSDLTGFDPNQVAVIQNNVAKNTTAQELAYFLNVCKSIELNPFNREVWCYKDHKGNLIIFAGRDGFLSNAQKRDAFNGMRSCEIRENDEWALDIPQGVVEHRITKAQKERGQIIGAYAIVFRKDGECTVEWAEFATYSRNSPTWKSHPADMIKKVAEAKALKKSFGMSGVQSEYDFTVQNGVAHAINTEDQDAAVLDTPEEQVEKLMSITDPDDLVEYAMSQHMDEDEDLSKLVRERLDELRGEQEPV